MPNVTLPIQESDALACQWRCSKTPRCVHFSFYALGKNCYLQDAFATRQTMRLGFVSGPFQCWDNLNHTAFVDVGKRTYLRSGMKCLEIGVLYSPIMNTPKYFKSGTGRDATKECARWCASEDGCGHWTIQFPARLCRLASHDARRLTNVINSVSGSPLSCGSEDLMQIDDHVNTSAEVDALIMKASASKGILHPSYPPFLALTGLLAIGTACISSLAFIRACRGARFPRREWVSSRSLSLDDPSAFFARHSQNGLPAE